MSLSRPSFVIPVDLDGNKSFFVFVFEKIYLAQLMLKDGLITKDQLRRGLQVQKEEGGMIGEIFVKMDLFDQGVLQKYLDKQMESGRFG